MSYPSIDHHLPICAAHALSLSCSFLAPFYSGYIGIFAQLLSVVHELDRITKRDNKLWRRKNIYMTDSRLVPAKQNSARGNNARTQTHNADLSSSDLLSLEDTDNQAKISLFDAIHSKLGGLPKLLSLISVRSCYQKFRLTVSPHSVYVA